MSCAAPIKGPRYTRFVSVESFTRAEPDLVFEICALSQRVTAEGDYRVTADEAPRIVDDET